jgi:hypothetical protein
MKRRPLILLAALVAAFLVPAVSAQTPTPQSCFDPATNACRKIPPSWTGEPQTCKENEWNVYGTCEQLCLELPKYCPIYRWPFDYGYCRDNGTCYPVPSPFGTIEGCAQLSTVPCTTPTPTPLPTPTPTPTPTPIPMREGQIKWRPATANYSQGAWAIRLPNGTIYLGAHAGHCCPALEDPSGWEAPFLMRFDDQAVNTAYPVIDLAWDTHEFGYGTAVRGWDGNWIYAASRSTKESWTKMLETGIGDRHRIMLAVTPDLMQHPYPWVYWDVIDPWSVINGDPTCKPRNVCGDRDDIGPFMPALVWVDNELLIFVHDPGGAVLTAGTAVYIIARCSEVGCGIGGKDYLPGFLPWSDLAFDPNSHRLYALISADENCWWDNCRIIREWVSADLGHSWYSTSRTWQSPGGQYIYDAAYVRNEWGHIDHKALTIIAQISETRDPTSGSYRFYYWSDPGAELPATWGFEPGAMISTVRRHLERRK